MSRVTAVSSVVVFSLALAVGAAARPAPEPAAAPADKIPITTGSEEARKLFLEARDLAENLRATDAQRLYGQAIAKDPGFALAYVGLANSAGTAKEFFDAVTKAAALAGKVSEGERHVILGLEAAVKGDPAAQERHYVELERLFPKDERAHNLLGTLYFGRQDFAKAIAEYEKATQINPDFAPVFNLLGYAQRSVANYADAEKAFKRYIELVPKDPNPYDSYAELLMKMGRFEASIENYEKALSLDPNFVSSYVGIGNDQMLMGRFDQARASFEKLMRHARNTGERRLAHFWNAASHVHQGATDKALLELGKSSALAEAEGDKASVSGDLNLMGDILREAGKPDAALARYGECVAMMDKSSAPEEVKQATRRNNLFDEGRVALAKDDLATAKARYAEYAKQVGVKQVPFEVRQQHELAGLIALAEKQFGRALSELDRSNLQDPRLLYLQAVAQQAAGNARAARELAKGAADFNGLSFSYAYVRTKAQKLASGS